MLSKKFVIKYNEEGHLFVRYKTVFADTPEEAVKTFNKVMGNRYPVVSVEEARK